MKNQVQLIAYVDRLSGGGFHELQALLQGPLAGLFGGVHLLPFYWPIGCANTCYRCAPRPLFDVRQISAREEQA